MRYEDRTFDGETVTLDNNEYVRCKFVRCTITYSGHPFVLDHPELDASTFAYEGAARNTVDLILGLVAAGAAATVDGSYVNIGDVWFKRADPPVGAPQPIDYSQTFLR